MYEDQANAARPQCGFSGVAGTIQQAERDPRENGNLTARLQVAEELVAKLRMRICNLADRINGESQPNKATPPDVHMQLLRFPDEIIADAKVMDGAINRIEGALGV